MRNKNLLHVIDSLVVGGAEILLVNTVNSMLNYNHRVITLLRTNNFAYELKDINTGCVNFSSKSKLFLSALRLRKIIKKNKIDIVHTHLFWSTLITRIACMGLNVKHVFSLHTIMSKDSFNNSKVMLWLEKLTYSKNQIVIGVSNAVLNDYDSQVGIKGKSYVLYNFINDSFFYFQSKVKKKLCKKFRMVAVGNIKHVKNYTYLIEVFKRLDNTKFILDIYGAGEGIENLRREVATNKLNIQFKGTSSELDSILPHYDAFVMASLYEGFGIAVLEAMAIGLPVLLSDIKVFREIAGDGAIFFDLQNKDSLTGILKNIGLIDLNSMSKKGRKRAEIIGRKEVYLEQLKFIYLN